MEKLVKTGPVVIRLRDFSVKNTWSLWQWKLEPFTVKENLKADITVDFGKHSDCPRISPLTQEKSGFYKRCVYSSQNGSEIHTLESKNETVISFYKNQNCISLIDDKTSSDLQAPFEFLSRTVIHSLLPYGVLTFHGVLMEHNGKGIIISAPSETGKTTHARLWRDHKNALILNGDNACCYKSTEWTAFSLPWSGTSGESINRSVSVKALVILEQSNENTVTKLGNIDTFSATLPNIQYPHWDKEASEKAIDLLSDFIKDIPVFRLTCRPDKDAADVLEKALEEIK